MSGQERKPRSYYVDYTKKRAGFGHRGGAPAGGSGTNNARFKEVPDFGSGGQRGFLITSVDEVKSYMEMRHALEQYYNEIYDKSEEQANQSANKKDTTTEDELESELKHLRLTRPFKQIRTHCRNAIFLNIIKGFEHVDPILMIDRFFEEMAQRRAGRTSNTFKVLPVLDTFRNSVACAKNSITSLFKDRFLVDEGPKRYFIEFQSRGNYKLESEDKQRMVEGVAEIVSELRPDWQVSRENVDHMIVLVALRNICCLSIVQNYFQRSKYNVIEFCKNFAPSEVPSGKVDKSESPQDDTRSDDLSVWVSSSVSKISSESQARMIEPLVLSEEERQQLRQYRIIRVPTRRQGPITPTPVDGARQQTSVHRNREHRQSPDHVSRVRAQKTPMQQSHPQREANNGSYRDDHHSSHKHHGRHHHHHHHRRRHKSTTPIQELTCEDMSMMHELASGVSYLGLDLPVKMTVCDSNKLAETTDGTAKAKTTASIATSTDLSGRLYIFEKVDYIKRVTLRRKALKRIGRMKQRIHANDKIV